MPTGPPPPLSGLHAPAPALRGGRRRSLAPSDVRSAAVRPVAPSSVPQPVSRVLDARLLSTDRLTLTGEPLALLPCKNASYNRFGCLDLKLI